MSSSSIVYCAVEPGTVRQVRVSLPAPSHCRLIGLVSVAFGAGALSHRVQ